MKIFNLIITTPKKVMEAAKEVYGEGMKAGAKIEKQTTKAYINPVIHDLEKLRANTWDDFVFAVGANVSSTCVYAPRKEGVYNEPSLSFDNDGSVWAGGAHGGVRLFKKCPPSLMYEMYIQRFNEFLGEK